MVHLYIVLCFAPLLVCFTIFVCCCKKINAIRISRIRHDLFFRQHNDILVKKRKYKERNSLLQFYDEGRKRDKASEERYHRDY